MFHHIKIREEAMRLVLRRGIHIRFFLHFLALLAVLCSSYGRNGPSSKTILRVGAFPHKPFVFMGDTGEPEGFFVELLDIIAQEEGWELVWVDGSWNEGLTRLESGQIDIVTSAAYSDERALKFDYPANGAYSLWTELYTTPKADIHSFEDLHNEAVGLMEGDINAQHFINKMNTLGIPFFPVWLPTFEDVFESIRNGKIDAGVSNNTFGYLNADEYGVRMTGLSISPFEIHFIVKKGVNGEILKRIDHWLDIYKHDANSVYYELATKWTNARVEVNSNIPNWVLNVLILFPIGLAVLLTNIYFLRRAVSKAIKKESKARKDLECEFQKNEEIRSYLETAVDASKIGIWDYDLVEHKVKYNETLPAIFGYTLKDFGSSFEFLHRRFNQEDWDALREEFELLMETPSISVNMDVRIQSCTDRWLWINIKGKATELNKNNVPTRLMGTYINVSHRKEAEAQLRESEARYKLLYSYLPVPYLRLSRDGSIVDLNPQWTCSTGYERNECLGLSLDQFLDPSSVKTWIHGLKILKSTGSINSFELALKKKNDQKAYTLFEGICAYDSDENPTGIYLTFNDITEQKLIKSESDENLKRLETAVEVARMSIIEWDYKSDTYHHDEKLHIVLDCNKADCVMTGSNFCEEFGALVEANYRAKFVKMIEGVRLGNHTWNEVMLRVSCNGEKFTWVRLVAKHVSSEVFSPSTVMIVVVDENEKTVAQLAHQEAKDNLQKADKLATLGTLASGIAHEINNPNQMILSNTQFLESFIAGFGSLLNELPEEQTKEYLMGIPFEEISSKLANSFGNIKGGSQRIKSIVSELKDYVRQKDYDFVPVDINKVIYSAQTLTSHFGKKKTDHFDWFAEPDLIVSGNFQKLEQVIVNVLVNAYESLTSKSQKVVIESKKQNEQVVVKITDEGVGIPENEYDRVTDPFFSTKQESGGTGMGLSVVSNILKKHGAKISFSKNSPQGTIVTIIFPTHQTEETR